MKFISTLPIISLIISVVYFSVNFFSAKDVGDFNCRASFMILNQGLNASIVATIKSDKSKGIISYDGSVFRQGAKVGYFNRKVDFNINRVDSFYLLTSSSVFNMKTDYVSQDIAEKILPDFFVRQNAKIYFDILNEDHGYIFVKDSIPMFYCRKLV